MIELYDESTHICNLEPGKAFTTRPLGVSGVSGLIATIRTRMRLGSSGHRGGLEIEQCNHSI